MKEWVFGHIDKAQAIELSKECEIDGFTSLLLCSKGICDPFLVDEFLSDEVLLQDPIVFKDIEKGASRINEAILNGEKIAVFGDYDCDGVTSTALLYSVLTQLGADCIWRVPSRDEGYGMSIKAVEELRLKDVKLIVTVDNGITAFDAIDRANKYGIDVVVTDHHLPAETLPNAYAIIDPKQADCPSEFKDYVGVGVAFMLCLVLCETDAEDLLYSYGDLVCLGTISDLMPLKSDNRCIVKQGLKCIKRGERLGLKKLVEASGISLPKLTSTNIAFTLAPRINASGRVFHPEKAIELLLCEEEDKASFLAEELCKANLSRREIESEILKEALEIISKDESMLNAPVIVVAGENWHHGVIGIVAAKLTNIFSRPAVVFSLDETYAVGSSRSYENASIFKILSEVSSLAESFGGHSSAAGITIKRENFEKVYEKIQQTANALFPVMPFDKLDISCKLNPKNISINNAYALSRLEPFGEGNQKPIFAIVEMKITNIIPLSGGKHLKLKLCRENDITSTVEVMMFFTTEQEFCYKIGDVVDVAVTLEINVFNGVENLSIIAKEVRPSSLSQDYVLSDIRAYQNFKFSGKKPENLTVNREEVAAVYKKIRAFKKLSLDDVTLGFVFKTSNLLKLKIILDILSELDFIKLRSCEKYEIEYNENVVSKSLDNSKTFNMFQ